LNFLEEKGEKMKKLMVISTLTILLCFTISCQDKEALEKLEEIKAQAELEELNKAVVLQWFDEIGKGNIEKGFEVCAPDYRLYYPSNTATPFTKEQNAEIALQMYQAFPDIVHEIKDIQTFGDKVMVRAVDIATHTNEYQGMPPTGKKFAIGWIIIFRLKDGKIAEAWEEIDSAGFMQQLGMEPVPKRD
jgi:steroid delta-isomerase-like uncharacterized protein